MCAEQEVRVDKTRDEIGQNKRQVWAEQKESLGKTEDEFGQNRRRVWAKQKEGLKSSVLNKDFCPLTFLSVGDRWLRARLIASSSCG